MYAGVFQLPRLRRNAGTQASTCGRLYTLVGSHAIYTMACNSNAAAAIGSWLPSKNSHHQTTRAHMEKAHGKGITSDGLP